MFQLFEFLLFVFFLPWILLGVFINLFVEFIDQLFHKPILFAAASTFAASCFLWGDCVPDETRPYQTLFEVAAQSTVFGLAMPLFLLLISIVLLLLAIAAKWAGSDTRRSGA